MYVLSYAYIYIYMKTRNCLIFYFFSRAKIQIKTINISYVNVYDITFDIFIYCWEFLWRGLTRRFIFFKSFISNHSFHSIHYTYLPKSFSLCTDLYSQLIHNIWSHKFESFLYFWWSVKILTIVTAYLLMMLIFACSYTPKHHLLPSVIN